MRHLPLVPVPVLVLVLVLGVGACEDSTGRTNAVVLPSGNDFRPVALLVGDRCGSLDCHGSKYRNMHIVGFAGSRLDPSDLPDSEDTTADEVSWDFDAIVSLEPDLTRAVAADHGKSPERLTFVRKGRGAEAHKGGTRIFPGDDADKCVVSWLSGAVDAPTCKRAVPRLANP